MSVKEIKVQLERTSAEQRAQVQSHLRILRWKESSKLTEKLTQAHRSMDEGGKISSDELEKHLEQLRAKKK